MKAKIALMSVFIFSIAVFFAHGASRARIVEMTLDEFFEEYGDIEHIVQYFPTIPREIGGTRAEQKVQKKSNKEIAANVKILDSMRKYTKEALEKDANAFVPNQSMAAKNTQTGAATLAIYMRNDDKLDCKGYWIFDGKGNIYLEIENAFGKYTFMEGPLLDELTGHKWCYVQSTSNYKAMTDKGDISSQMTRTSEWMKNSQKFVTELTRMGSAMYSVVRSARNSNYLN